MSETPRVIEGQVLRTAERGPLMQGAHDTLPFVPAAIVWGAIFGAAATVLGLSRLAADVMSTVIYSGTAQLAILKILASPILSIFLTSLLLSLRFLPMTLAINHRLAISRWRRVLVCATLVDSGFALAAVRDFKPGGLARYLLGAWLASYVAWISGTLAGAAIGPSFPAAWIPVLEGVTVVIFVIITAELCTSRPQAAAALVGAVTALALHPWLPTGVAIIVAAVAASGVMALARARRPAASPEV